MQARFRSSEIVLNLGGDIDTSNVDKVTANLQQFISTTSPLILDLRWLDFLSVSGLRALVAVDYQYREAGLSWAVVTGPALRPHLRVKNDDLSLPVVSSMAAALRYVHNDARAHTRRLRIVSGWDTLC
jgi:anti-anti-sigma factor